jgi:hypothetical protein
MIIPEQHIVASRYDPLTGLCHYTVEHPGQTGRRTVSIPLADLDKHPAGVDGIFPRRTHLLRCIAERMKGDPDPEPAAR